MPDKQHRTTIPTDKLRLNVFTPWFDWALLTAGDFAAKQYNCMTVSWGSMGVMWNKPFVHVVVRPQRHTRGFIDKYETFTLSLFPKQCHAALQLLGSKSGRDCDKVQESGLTPVTSAAVAAPGFEEAHLVLECRKSYFADFEPKNMLADFARAQYEGDYHRQYFGEIVAVQGTGEFVLV
jgi:flavin reductase (DIM6/NTAB) family NADH-FMN oxidoreductase RutF